MNPLYFTLPYAWVVLFQDLWGYYSPRTFISNFGLSTDACAFVWQRILLRVDNIDPKYLLLVLHYLRCYNTFDVIHLRFGICDKTSRDWIKYMLQVLEVSLQTVHIS